MTYDRRLPALWRQFGDGPMRYKAMAVPRPILVDKRPSYSS